MPVSRAAGGLRMGLLGLALLVFCLAAQVAADERLLTTEPFRKVHFLGGGQLALSQGIAAPVRVNRNNAADRVLVECVDGVLYVDTRHMADPHTHVQVQAEDLDEIYVQGAVDVLVTGLHTEHLLLEGHGPGSMSVRGLQVKDLVVTGRGGKQFRVSGEARHQSVDLAGVSWYQADGLATQTTQLNVQGAGRVELWVAELLDVNILGAARVLYNGTPWVLQQIYGAGAVHRL